MITCFPTSEVMVGKIGIGGNNPVRVQSMTNTDTLDTIATLDQIKRLSDTGCEIVRLAVPGIREARHLSVIKDELHRAGYDIPLIADVHFTPEAALISAELVEKVRINPGNYTDRKVGKVSFTDADFKESQERISEKILPLIEICKKNKTVLRIGSNYGSLSERIVSRYGNTPEGMVEAALEFVRICRRNDFHDIVLSMKASSVRMMVYANRLLVKRMIAEGMSYPIHLGVTEAGNDAEGRLKSAIGLGALLADGIGNTIRVSLTEKPENEIPAAKEIIGYFDDLATDRPFDRDYYLNLPHSYQPEINDRNLLKSEEKKPLVINVRGDYGSLKPDLQIDGDKTSVDFTYIKSSDSVDKGLFIPQRPIVFESTKQASIIEFRDFLKMKRELSSKLPVILKKSYSQKDILIEAAIDFGPIFLDNLADGIWITGNSYSSAELVELSFNILQACSVRIFKTEYIACPSCGRTLYDIQTVFDAIKRKTSHLKGLKIAVMGCIVNGPGEMADADYGYIGMGLGKAALFKGKTAIVKGVPESEAMDRLIELIKENGDWIDAE